MWTAIKNGLRNTKNYVANNKKKSIAALVLTPVCLFGFPDTANAVWTGIKHGAYGIAQVCRYGVVGLCQTPDHETAEYDVGGKVTVLRIPASSRSDLEKAVNAFTGTDEDMVRAMKEADLKDGTEDNAVDYDGAKFLVEKLGYEVPKKRGKLTFPK